MATTTAGSTSSPGMLTKPNAPGRSATITSTRSAPNNISSSEMQYIVEGCRDNFRNDGRSCTDYRNYTITTTHHATTTTTTSADDNTAAGPLVLSNGSARILLPGGGTHVLCSVKADLVHPAPDAPNEGVVDLHVDRAVSSMTARSSQSRQADMELQSLLRRLWLPHVVDRQSLCVIPKQYVWRLNIDLLILACQGGNIVDVCAMVMRAALQRTKLPKITPLQSTNQMTDGSSTTKNKTSATSDLAVDGDIANAINIVGDTDADCCPIVVTVNIVKCPQTILVLDATLEEEACALCQVSVAVDRQQRICGVCKHNTGSIAFGLMNDISAMAVQASRHAFEEIVTNHEEEATPQDLLQDHFRIR